MSYSLIEDRDRSYQRDEGRNFLIEGDNLKALKALSARFEGRVKCVYLDPPYNTGEKFKHYKDKTDTATWAEGMQKLLTRARALLTDDGSVWCSIDDHEVHTLRTVLDTVFGRQNFVATVIWERRNTRENRACFSVSHDYVLVYAKDAKCFKAARNKLPYPPKSLAAYKNPDNDPRGPWQPISFLAQSGRGRPAQQYTLKTPAGIRLTPPEGSCWRYTKERYKELLADNLVYFGRDGKGKPVSKMFLSVNAVPSLYKNPDNDPRGPWRAAPPTVQDNRGTRYKQHYELVTPMGEKLLPPPGRAWSLTKPRHEELLADGRVWFGLDGTSKPSIKKFLSEEKQPGLTPHTLWTAAEVSTNGEAKKHLVSLFPGREFPFDHPKPEQLLQRILHIATNPGDLVLDLYGGSGTTAAVAHKMGRRWILVERGEHCDAVIRKRLKKVVRGTDPGGCTQAVGWKGGGGFRFCTIKKTTR